MIYFKIWICMRKADESIKLFIENKATAFDKFDH